MKGKTRVLIALTIFVFCAVLAATAPAFADGGPLILCPPKAKNCKCTLPHC